MSLERSLRKRRVKKQVRKFLKYFVFAVLLFGAVYYLVKTPGNKTEQPAEAVTPAGIQPTANTNSLMNAIEQGDYQGVLKNWGEAGRNNSAIDSLVFNSLNVDFRFTRDLE